MKAKLYSQAHLDAAQSIFTEKYHMQKWLDEQWKDHEINACKLLEMNGFINSPSLESYPLGSTFAAKLNMQEDFHIAQRIISKHKNIQRFLSVGCGLGAKEMMLAKCNPSISFIAIDNAPYVEQLNLVAKELKLTNIIFKNGDLRDGGFKNFDVVYSFAVIYCIPDEYLKSYFKSIMDALNPNGFALVGCSSNYHFQSKIVHFVRIMFPKFKRVGGKQTGWLRDVNSVKQFIPKQAIINQCYEFDYLSELDSLNGKPIAKAFTMRYIFEMVKSFVYSVSNRSYMFVLRN